MNTIIASFFYTGGNHIDPNSPGYSFMWNYVSDLGRTNSLSGELNLVSRIIFTITLSLVGLSAVIYSIVFTEFFKEKKLSSIRIVALISGISYGLCYVIIGYLPLDVLYTPHTTFVITAGFLRLIALFFFALLILKNQNYPNFYAYLYIIYNGFFILFFVFLIFSYFSILLPFLPTCIIGQKLSFYFEAGLYIIQSIGALKYLSASSIHKITKI
ncbi:MAG: DUF998 domain-containing protein [Asgard group archaeon]|nr:DUF998 domain-containing protein [Asgard group archaeon]